MKATTEATLNAPKGFNMAQLHNSVWPMIEAGPRSTPF